MAVINRFNNINSKEWLPFQKSWFVYENDESLYRSNFRFFTQKNEEFPLPKIYYSGPNGNLALKVGKEEERQICTVAQDQLQFALVDLREKFTDLESYKNEKKAISEKCIEIFENLLHRKFLCVLIENIATEVFAPIAWDLAKSLGSYYSLKDEKIGVYKSAEGLEGEKHFYALYFRKDEKSAKEINFSFNPFLETGVSEYNQPNKLGTWQVVRPPRRKPNEILHPAKYPEQLIEQFISEFTKEGDAVFDPMSGTGSTQVAALNKGRNAYGCELSPFFAEIAHERAQEMQFGTQLKFKIANIDANNLESEHFPPIQYVITSPPYWDMLNMKGAEYQARRKEKGLQLNYSDHENDLGNVADYEQFVKKLVAVYKTMNNILVAGAHITIIIKNIKKKGTNYPFAWDLANELSALGWKLLPEFFWCQDDINLAPYGYGNTWVSNTFHQYCLTFEKV